MNTLYSQQFNALWYFSMDFCQSNIYQQSIVTMLTKAFLLLLKSSNFAD